MRALSFNEMSMDFVAGGPSIDPGNVQIIEDITIDAGLGAAFTLGTP